ncbi:MAG: polyribonucleotide nucleotidyltransferase [Patescibacteria group bacterium]
MLNRKQFTIEIAGKPLTFEISRLAEQANAAVIASYGDTAVLATVVMDKGDRDIDYLPLTVDYEEKFYAAGKILGSRYMRREGKSSDEAVLSGRLIDRTMRPLFDQSIRREIQVILTVLSIDGENDPDFVALMAASAAVAISDIPWNGPVAGIGVAKVGDKLVVNPTTADLVDGFVLDGFASGPKDRINMIELEGNEAQEEDVFTAFELAQSEINKLVDFIQTKIVAEIGKKKVDIVSFKPDQELTNKIQHFLGDRLEKALYIPNKKESYDVLYDLKKEMMAMMDGEEYSAWDKSLADHIFEHTADEIVHKKTIEEGVRQDGRQLDEIRDLYGEVGLFRRNHGSALFVRGSTQALAVTTLASPDSEQMVETMEFTGKKRFMLHYNFPPYSVGETGRLRGPGRRDIGHGALAEKAVRSLIPSREQFPYAIRVVSEIMSSNGSSSMATVCATSLSLMDAGVPIKKQVAGIAMGLMLNEKGDYKILTDVQGSEDHHGDMDFKVAGTRDGVTAIQLDVKVVGLTPEIIKKTLEQAKKARLQILDVLDKVIDKPREKVSEFAPRISVIKIDPEKIGMVVGSGGKMINEIIEKTGIDSMDIDQDGSIFIVAKTDESAEAAKRYVEGIVHEYKVGEIVEGNIVKIMEFGAILEFAPGQDGMIHISELKEGFVKKVEEVVKMGDFVRAKIIRMERGKMSLSLKGLK